jgi:hypothetical protein
MLLRSSGISWPFVESLVGGWRDRSIFHSLRRCAVFLGHPRGGGSLVGALLNAHPQTCLAADAGLFQYLRQGYRRSQLLWLVYRKDRAAGRRLRLDGDYRFAVPGQWQGCFESLRVIGDVKTGNATEWLARHPECLEELEGELGVPLRIIQLVRDPFQVVLSQHRAYPHIPIQRFVEDYFRRCEVMDRVARERPEAVLVARLEELLSSPTRVLASLCAHLGLDADAAYLDACQLVVHELTSARTSVTGEGQGPGRDLRRPFPRAMVERIDANVERFAFLRAYRRERADLREAA